jgi:hypothetical protein
MSFVVLRKGVRDMRDISWIGAGVGIGIVAGAGIAAVLLIPNFHSYSW